MEKNEIDILLVEDNPGDARLTTEMLKECDSPYFKTAYVKLAEDALKILNEEKFDVVLLDLNLPDTVGFDGLERITAQNPQIPVIVLTGLEDETIGVQALQKHASDYLVKGQISTNLLTRSIRYAIERKKNEMALEASRVEILNEKNRLEAMMQTLPVGVAIIDSKGGTVLSNSEFDKVWGAPRPATRSVEDYSLYKAWWADSGKPVKPEEWASARAIQKGETVVGQLMEIERFDGPHRFVMNSAAPIKNERGEIVGSAVAIVDISERKWAEEAFAQSQARLELAQRAAGAGVWDWDIASGRIQWSRELFGLYGLDPEKIQASFENWRHAVHPEDLADAEQRINQAAKDGTPLASEYRVIYPNGEVHWISALGSTTHDQHRKPIRMSGICLDITERKQSEDAFKESELRYRRLFESAKDGILILDYETGSIVDANPFLSDLLGYSLGDLLDKHLWDIGLFKDIVSSKASYLELQTKKYVRYEDLPLQLKNGKKIEVEFVSNVYLVDHKQVIQCNIRDITERKRVEDELHRLNRTLRAHSDSDHAIMRAESESDYLNEVCKIIVNDCGHTMTWIGYTEDDEAKTVRPVAQAGFEEGYLETLNVTWADTERGRGPTGTAIRTRTRALSRNILTDPHFKPWREEALKRGYASSIALPLIADDKVLGALMIYSKEPDPFSESEVVLLEELASDLAYGITAIRTGRALEEAEIKHSTLLQTVQSGYCFFDLEGKLLEVNDAYCRLSGYSKDELLGMNIKDIEVNEKGDDVFAQIRIVKEKGHHQFETKHRRKDGAIFDVDIRSTYLDIEGGRMSHFVWDISDRKRSEQMLRESEEHFRTLADTMPQIVWSMDASGAMNYYNKRALEYGGIELENINNWDLVKVVHPDDYEATMAKWKRSLETGELFASEQRLRRFDGEYRWHITRGVAVRDGQGYVTRWIGSATDIHDQKLAEDVLKRDKETLERLAKKRSRELIEIQMKLEKTKRLSDIGTLAATVAHELRNPLASIKIATFNIKRKTEGSHIDSHLTNINLKIQESEQIINNLLFYSKIKVSHFQTSDIHDLLMSSMEEVSKRFSSARVTLEQETEGIRNMIFDVDPLQIRGVFINILNNAYDAIDEKEGKITVKASVHNNFVIVTFKDSGEGMVPEDIEKAFDPFFTTKAKGTGLGLSVCRQIMNLHDGSINLSSNKDEGTTATVILPIVTDRKKNVKENTSD